MSAIVRLIPSKRPNGMPMARPMTLPTTRRISVSPKYDGSSPLTSISPDDSETENGDGR
jgi:hypothetical protein